MSGPGRSDPEGTLIGLSALTFLLLAVLTLAGVHWLVGAALGIVPGSVVAYKVIVIRPQKEEGL